MKITENIKKELEHKQDFYVLKLPEEVINFFKSGGNLKITAKKGSKIHIKKKNRGKFTDYCGGNVTSECIARGKRSPNPVIRKRATFADNARHFKHRLGGNIVTTYQIGGTAGTLAKKHLTLRKNPDWDNLDRGYRYLTKDMGLDHDSAIALMGNVVEESQGYYNMAQKNGSGRGLIQWDGRPTPKGRYAQWAHILRSVTTPANRRNQKTGQTENYWKSIDNQTGEQLRQKFNNPKTSIKAKTQIYSKSYLRPGKPRMTDRELSAAQLDSVYNPRIKNTIVRIKKKGGSMRIPGVIDSNTNLDNMKGNYVSKKKPLKRKKYGK